MLKKMLIGASLLCAAGFTSAATITLTDTVAVQTTNFTTSLTFAKFDTMGGTRVLDSVAFSIDGSIFGSAEVESRDNAPATIVTTLEATLTLTDALTNVLVVTIPSVTNTFNATAYDNVLDFGGTSGITYPDLTANMSNSESYMDAATLAFFTATMMGETTTFSFDATATSSATGAGNITSGFNTTAGGEVQVIYTYTDVPPPNMVSAPSHVALLGLGLLAFAGLRKVRK
jgi:hypothetical protein